ncbi:nuclear transport factor 2 family protein [Paenibacillus qinlingensis]|uniref:nuclear transport factor 2 family protein n=1 Tax=Paenibacillus qinlingensis TaxID=1837343 RepID=UPI0015632C6E|nr:nuclear transport factor 2 family protein [Paenibacillus qinlingensis]NQX57998.1 nuclear transport factor 2 family protein [Paenibacillus qinlingensis]
MTNTINNEQENLINRLIQLEQKSQRLEDIEEIKKLKARYFRFVDEKKWTDFGDLFTADATLISQGQDFSAGGGQAYGKMIGDLVGKAPTVHHGHMPEIDIIDKDNAKGIWSIEDLLTFPDAKDAYPGHNGYGQYREMYRKENGTWKISSTELTRFRMDPLKNWDPNTDPVTGQPVTSK